MYHRYIRTKYIRYFLLDLLDASGLSALLVFCIMYYVRGGPFESLPLSSTEAMPPLSSNVWRLHVCAGGKGGGGGVR